MLRVNFKTDERLPDVGTVYTYEDIHIVSIEDDFFHIDDMPQILNAINRLVNSHEELHPEMWYQVALKRRRDVEGKGPMSTIRLWFELESVREWGDVTQDKILADRVRKSKVSFLEELDAWLSFNTYPTAEQLLSMRHDLQIHIIKEKKYGVA